MAILITAQGNDHNPILGIPVAVNGVTVGLTVAPNGSAALVGQPPFSVTVNPFTDPAHNGAWTTVSKLNVTGDCVIILQSNP